jgi:two-component system, NarL family, nitrate/nitrite response regulator NarL
MPSISCVVVHPRRIIREGFRSILAKSPFEPVYTASSSDDVPSAIAGTGEQVLVLVGAKEACKLAQAVGTAKIKFPAAHVVAVGDCRDPDLVMAAFASGATSIVDEDEATSSLIKKLELVTQGEPVISALVLKRLLGNHSVLERAEIATTHAPEELVAVSAEYREIVATPPVAELPAVTHNETQQGLGLSSREAAILKALVQGAPNKVIACQLKISEATVKVHVKAILRKIRVKNRTQAAIWALHQQALPPSPARTPKTAG